MNSLLSRPTGPHLLTPITGSAICLIWDLNDYDRAEVLFSKALALEEALVRNSRTNPVIGNGWPG